MSSRSTPPLPRRFGLEPARLRMPADGPWATLYEHLVERLPREDPDTIAAMLRAGEIVDMAGPLNLDSPFVPGAAVWLHRPLPKETHVPFDMIIVHRDENLLVVDKPHFLATIPRGQHILQTALVRLRHELDLPELVPAHRLDRATAGLVMFVVAPARRGAYQEMFRHRRVRKQYEAIARYDPGLTLPATVRSRIVKDRGVVTAREVAGEPNAESVIELLEHRTRPDGQVVGRYRLLPHTGRTHQLRLHMNRLGIPILGDDFYPVLTDTAVDDFANPLQLLAKALEFDDPVTGEPRRFASNRRLAAWDAS